MDKNTVLLRDTEAFMRGELDNVTGADIEVPNHSVDVNSWE